MPQTKSQKFAKLMSRYKRYDPKTEGYGSVDSWRAAWNEKMGIGEAKEYLGSNDPVKILGFLTMPNVDELKTAYRRLIKIHHPDAGGNPEMAKSIIAAYTILLERLQ